jgi:hypothetical protein
MAFTFARQFESPTTTAMSESKFSGKKVKIVPEDGAEIEVALEVTNMAKSIAAMIADIGGDCGDMPIPVKVKADILAHVFFSCFLLYLYMKSIYVLLDFNVFDFSWNLV